MLRNFRGHQRVERRLNVAEVRTGGVTVGFFTATVVLLPISAVTREPSMLAVGRLQHRACRLHKGSPVALALRKVGISSSCSPTPAADSWRAAAGKVLQYCFGARYEWKWFSIAPNKIGRT